MKKILITGALGQIGSELTQTLRNKHGDEKVIATDIRMPSSRLFRETGPFEVLDVLDEHQITRVMQQHGIGTIYHLAAILSAIGETRPNMAWQVNMGGLYNMLEAARQYKCSMFFPSSIGAFGPSTPKNQTGQDVIMRPETMYGITKLSGELLCDYYFRRFDVDTRGVRFPGLISYKTEPGGGTTDYAVEIFFEAIKHKTYTCYLRSDSSLDMMYMPDAVKAMVDLMEADPDRLEHRNAFNISAMSLSPQELADEIRKHIPEFEINYEVDPARQEIADSWPDAVDDSAARAEWGWSPDYNLKTMTADMIEKIGSNASKLSDKNFHR